MFDWPVGRAEESGCDHLRLAARVARFGARRLYLNRRMAVGADYFSRRLK